jgi:hypothetical protein
MLAQRIWNYAGLYSLGNHVATKKQPAENLSIQAKNDQESVESKALIWCSELFRMRREFLGIANQVLMAQRRR